MLMLLFRLSHTCILQDISPHFGYTVQTVSNILNSIATMIYRRANNLLEWAPGLNDPEQVEFAEVGTLATIIHFEAVQPSLFMLRCQGGQRFKILQCELQANGLWRAEVELIAPDEVVGIPPELLPTADALTKIIRTLEDQGIAPDQRPIIQPYQLQDCAWVANRCAELLDLPSQQKQHLLAMENPRLRLDLVQELLEDMGVFKEPE